MTAKAGDQRPDTIQKALGFQLTLARKNAGYKTQVDLANSLGITDSPIAKAESGYQPPSPHLFEQWMDACGVKGQLAIACESMYYLARLKDDPQAYQASSWEETEEQARSLLYWELTLVPGVAQTEDYARALFEMWRNSPDKVAELTARRINRQQVLTKPDAPDVVMVIWERALHTLVGSPEIMVDQLGSLLELSDLPNVYIHILPAGVRAGMGMAGPVSIADTDTGEAAVMEAAYESPVMTDASLVKLANAILNSVRASAKDVEGSKMIITEAMETWKARTAGGSPATAGTQPGTV